MVVMGLPFTVLAAVPTVIDGGIYESTWLVDGSADVTVNDCTFTGTSVVWAESGQTGTVTINGGTFNAIALTVSDYAPIIINGGTFNLEGLDSSYSDADITIFGGTFSCNPSAYIAEECEITENGNGVWTVTKKVLKTTAVIEGGEYTAPIICGIGSGEYKDVRELTVDGGTFNSAYNFQINNGELIINDGEFTADGFIIWGNGARVTINGGTFTAPQIMYTDIPEDVDLTIYGGTFSIDPTPYVPTGIPVVQNGDGTWTVGKTSKDVVVSFLCGYKTVGESFAITVGIDKTYISVDEALAYIPDGYRLVNYTKDAYIQDGWNYTTNTAEYQAYFVVEEIPDVVDATVRYYVGDYDTVAEGETVQVAPDAVSYPIDGLIAPEGYKIVAEYGEVYIENGSYYVDVKVEVAPIPSTPLVPAEVKATVRYYVGNYETIAEGETVTVKTDAVSYPVDGLTVPEGYRIVAEYGEVYIENGRYYVDVEVEEIPLSKVVTIYFDATGGYVNPTSADTDEHGRLAVFPTPTKNGYDFIGWYMADGQTRVETTTVFNSSATIYAKWEQIPESDNDDWYWTLLMLYNREFEIEATASNGGTVTPAGISKVKYSKSQTYEIIPNNGYEIVSVYVDGKDMGSITSYTFKNIKSNHTISAVFVKTAEQNQFNDVFPDDWFYANVLYVYEKGLMIGTDSELGLFSPELELNRATLVTTLWRLSGSPLVDTDVTFTDLNSGEWYSDAMYWAIANGIVLGYGDDTCRPLDKITHEQICAVFMRYSELCGLDVGIPSSVTTDVKYNAWAKESVLWAEYNGLFKGFGSDVSNLTGTANRAEIAAYLRRLCGLLED